jgi:hypothetical protein
VPWSMEGHRTELVQILTAVRKDIEDHSAGSKKMRPPRFATYLWHLFRKESIPADVLFNDSPGQAVRKIHDFYGWKAKETAEKRGLCSGALYRTAGYMAHAPNARVGRKGQDRTVHIEHSVPIADLRRLLERHANHFDTPGALHNFLILHSVATALSQEEEDHMKGGTVKSSRNIAFQNTGERTGDHPFLRYKPLLEKGIDFRIFNIVTGEEINIETFTFEDHRSTLLAASDLCGSQSGLGLGVYDFKAFSYYGEPKPAFPG